MIYSISTIPKILMMQKCEGFVDAIGFEDDDNACNSQDHSNTLTRTTTITVTTTISLYTIPSDYSRIDDNNQSGDNHSDDSSFKIATTNTLTRTIKNYNQHYYNSQTDDKRSHEQQSKLRQSQ